MNLRRRNTYEILLEKATKSEDRALYKLLARVGVWQKAITYYEKHLEYKKKSVALNDLSLGNSYNNIGLVYHNMGEVNS